MAQIPELTCYICQNKNGKYFCYDCHIVLCDKCKNDHYKYPANKHHTIKETHSKILPVKYECEIHHKDYLHYCQTCESLICSECITLEHNGHVFKDIKSIADNARKTVLEAICNLKTKQQTSTRAKDEISSSKMVKIQNDTEKFISEVHCLSKSLKEIIETVVKTELTFAGDFLDLEKTKLESFLETLNESVDAHSSVINKLENTLLESHDVTFYFNQSKILNEFQGSESDDIPTFEEIKDLQKFETADFIDKVVEKIQIKHGIRSFQNKEIQEKQLSERLKQEEIIHQQTKEANIAERQKWKETIQSKDHQVGHLLKQIKQDVINHKQTIEAIVAERQKLEVTIQSKENKEKQLSERLKQEEISHQQTKEANIAERQQLKATIQRKEIQGKQLSERLKQEEINHKQTKEALITERQIFQAKIQREEMKKKELSDQLKQEGLEHKQTKEAIKTKIETFQAAIKSKDTQVENICKQLRQEEISHHKMKEAIIAERQKMKTYLKIVLLGECGAGISATGNTLLGKEVFDSLPNVQRVTEYIEKNVVFFAGKKIDIFDTPGSLTPSDCPNTLQRINKRLKSNESKVIFVYNFQNGRPTQSVLEPFELFYASCMERSQKFVIVFTHHKEILEEIESFEGKGDEECTFDYQWLKRRSPTVSTKVQQNDIRCMFIENNCSWESREKYRRKLFSICGINIV